MRIRARWRTIMAVALLAVLGTMSALAAAARPEHPALEKRNYGKNTAAHAATVDPRC